MGIHDGHRDRMKNRFLRHGLGGFDDVTALELLLFYAMPRQDTNPLAHRLLQVFGSFSAVLDASEQELLEVEGVGENAAALLRLIPAAAQRYLMDKHPGDELMDTPSAAALYFVPRFLGETREVVYALLLNARQQPIACRELSRGVVNAAEIHARKLCEMCLALQASSVILAHNHLSGIAMPSAEDEITTEKIRNALAMLGVELSDHLVVAGAEYVSMRELGMLEK